jgi:hypothetical protein
MGIEEDKTDRDKPHSFYNRDQTKAASGLVKIRFS